jgi:hypothetical protein
MVWSGRREKGKRSKAKEEENIRNKRRDEGVDEE